MTYEVYSTCVNEKGDIMRPITYDGWYVTFGTAIDSVYDETVYNYGDNGLLYPEAYIIYETKLVGGEEQKRLLWDDIEKKKDEQLFS